MYLSEEIFYDSLGIGIQIRGGAKSALRCPRIWLPKFDVIILEAIAYKVNGGIQIRGFGWGIQIRGDPNPRLHMHRTGLWRIHEMKIKKIDYVYCIPGNSSD